MASRKIEDLHPAVEPLCRRFLALCGERGIRAIVTSTFRTEAEQLALFAQGRKDINAVNELRREAGLPPIMRRENRIVTRALTSIHQFGCAFDVVIVKGTPSDDPSRQGRGNMGRLSRLDGKGRGEEAGMEAVWEVKADINSNDAPDYEEMGIIGESVGLTWGGRFRFRDYCHFEHTGGLTLDDLKAGRRPGHSPTARNYGRGSNDEGEDKGARSEVDLEGIAGRGI